MNGRIPSLSSRWKARVIDGLTFAVITGSLVLSGQVIKCCGGVDTDPKIFYAELLPIPAGIPGNSYFYAAHALFWWLLIIGLIPSFLVEVPMVALAGGTFGKLMAGSKVIRVRDGGKPGWWRSFIRWLVLYGLMAVPVLGWSVLLLNIARLRRDPERRGIHDRLSGTTVLKTPAATGDPNRITHLAPAMADRPRSLAGWRSLARLYDWGVITFVGIVSQLLLYVTIVDTMIRVPTLLGGEPYNSGTTWGTEVPNSVFIDNDAYPWFWIGKLVLIAIMVPAFLYEIPMVALSGRTVGKMMARLKVVNVEDGQLPGWKRSTVRWLVLYGPMLIPIIGWILVLLIYFVSTALDPNRRPLHDRIAGTTVIRQDRGPEEPPG